MGGGDSDFSGIESSRDERPLPPLPSPEMNSPLEANTERPLGDTRDRRNGEGSSSQQNDIVEQALLRSPSNFASASDAGPSIGTSTAVEGEPVQPTSLKSTGGPESNSQLEEINSLAEMPAYQTQERFASQLVTSSRDVANVYSSTHGYSSGSDSLREPLALSHTYSEGRRREQYVGRGHSIEQSQIIIPRWQPDAEVTLCPICRTQFSFFIRKHHCRKCGRVVCGSCSPHRITIPYQFIVQPPTETTSATIRARPALDSGRVGSFTIVDNIGGGERVRLCNPCVPDPNVAPPPVADSSRRPSHHGHGRSASSATTSNNSLSRNSTQASASPPVYYNQQGRQRQTSIRSPYNQSTASYSENSNRLTRSGEIPYRSRSSTVGNSRASSNMSASQPNERAGQPQFAPLPAPREPVRDDDECWVCHRELPSRTLPDFEKLRIDHVDNCVKNAERGHPPAPVNIPPQAPGQAGGSQAPQLPRPIPAPIADTPEARTAARESAHAAIVLAASSSSTSPGRRSGCFPYKASEKDCVDDAECTICMEDYKVGDNMGRLECFCRFHLHCIREWFVTHPGQCPVHQHGAGY